MIRKNTILLFAVVVIIETALILFSWKITYFKNPYVVINVDNCFSAQVARNIVNGEGYRANALSLYEVGLYDKKGWLSDGPPWRNTYRFPLPILTMSILFQLFGDSHFTANFLYPSIFHLFSVIALFSLVYYHYKDHTTAFIASMIFLTNQGLLFTMLNKSEGADIFFFILSLLAFFVCNKRQNATSFFILGLILGLSFLNRFNEGAILFITYVIIVCFKKRFSLRNFSLYFAGFIIPLIPFIIQNVMMLGTPFFSSNSYFQLIEQSIISKYMNPWGKLNYSIDVTRPLIYPLLYPADFLARAFYYIKHYTVAEFLRFRGSLWWWIPLAYVLFKRPIDPKTRDLGVILFIIFLLHIILIAPFGLNIRYIQFLFIPVIIIVATTLREWCRNVRKSSSPLFYRPNRSTPNWRPFFGFPLVAFVIIAALLPLYLKLPLYISLSMTIIVIISIVIGLKKKSLEVVLVCIFLTLLYSSILWLKERYEVFDIYAQTAEDPSVLREIKESMSNRQVVVTTHPWNTGWFSERPSLSIPEYPDEIYLLMKQYGFDIRAIYFSHFNAFLRYVNTRTPISLHSYLRLNKFDLPIRGFTNAKPLMKGGLLLYRDDDPLTDVLNTKEIDFGTDNANSHLVYGFSSAKKLGGSSVCWILEDASSLFYKPEFRLIKDDKVLVYDMPQAEITFLKDGNRLLRDVKLELFSAGSEEFMTVVLNSNLFSYGDKGFFIATIPLRKGWNVIDLPFEKNNLRQGLNKLSFWFTNRRTFSDFQKDGGSKDEKDGSEKFLGIAFHKTYFEYD